MHTVNRIKRFMLHSLVVVLLTPLFAAASDEVEKGRYLARIGNCMGCHTASGGMPYAGGVRFETAFGVIYSTNITQDRETGIGLWSRDDFRAGLRKGLAPGGKRLYPVFPYPAYSGMTDSDIDAIYAYLQTIEPVNAPARDNELRFPFGFRGLMLVWNTLFHREGSFQPVAEQSEAWNRGAYLAQTVGHCGTCHTPRNLFGAEDRARAFSGGVYTGHVIDGKYRQWSAVNLTPAPTGLGAWSHDDLVAYFSTGSGPRSVSTGQMGEVLLNSIRPMTATDIAALAVYLQSLPASTWEEPPAPPEADLRAGAGLYSVHCSTCHLPTGLGERELGAPLKGSAVVQAPDPSSLINKILYGGRLQPPYPFESGRRTMDHFYDTLNDREVAQVATFIRNSWSNKGTAVSAEEVKQQR